MQVVVCATVKLMAADIGATTTGKLEATSRAVDADPLPFSPALVLPVSRCCFTHISPVPFPALLSSRSGEAV